MEETLKEDSSTRRCFILIEDYYGYGEMSFRGKTLPACCTKPDLVKSWIFFNLSIFKGVYCLHCGDFTSTMNKFMDFIFTTFFLPFWDGTTYYYNKQERRY